MKLFLILGLSCRILFAEQYIKLGEKLNSPDRRYHTCLIHGYVNNLQIRDNVQKSVAGTISVDIPLLRLQWSPDSTYFVVVDQTAGGSMAEIVPKAGAWAKWLADPAIQGDHCSVVKMQLLSQGVFLEYKIDQRCGSRFKYWRCSFEIDLVSRKRKHLVLRSIDLGTYNSLYTS